MDFRPVNLPSITAAGDTASLSTVVPRLTEGMVLSAVVLRADGPEVTVRFRGMDVRAQSQIQLQAGARISLVVSELSPQRIVFRVARADLMPPDMISLTNADLEPLLRQASLPTNQENLAAVRALILNGQSLRPENITGLVTAARTVGGFSPANLDAVIFLQTRDLPVTPATVALAAIILVGGGDPAEIMPRLETMARGTGTGTASTAAGAPAASPSAAAPAAAQALPPQVARALDQLIQIFPRLEIGGGTGPPSSAPGATTPAVGAESTTPGTAAPVTSPGLQSAGGSAISTAPTGPAVTLPATPGTTSMAAGPAAGILTAAGT